MGQCHSNYDDDARFNTIASLVSQRKSSSSSESFSADDINSNKNTLKKSFLKLHRPDPEAKWILDQNNVFEALQFQSDEMMKSEGFYDDIYAEDTAEDFEGRRNGAESVFSGGFSDYAPSEMTTGTAATLPMGNVNRHMPNKRITQTFNEKQHQMNPASRNHKHLHDNLAIAERKEGTLKLYSKLLTACSQPKQDWQIRQEELLSVLHLKMKANLGYYYLDRFLKMFPKSARGIDFSNSNNAPPSAVEFESTRSSNSVYYSTTGDPFLDLAFTGSLGLVPRTERPPRRVASSRHNQKSPDHYIVLINRISGTPIAVCSQKADSTSKPIVRIYATKRRVFGQRPAATTVQLGLDWGGNLPLFAWAEIVTDSMFPNPLQFSMYMASGSDGRFATHPTFLASFEDHGESVIKIVGRTDMERASTGCALISLQVYGDSTFFEMGIASGIDPSLVMCFTAVMDEIIEKSMRLQCQSR